MNIKSIKTMVERIPNQYTNVINNVVDILLLTFFSLHMISLSNAEIYIYLAVTYYWPLSIPVFGKIKYFLAVETIGVTQFLLMQHCKFCILPMFGCIQSLLRDA